MEQISVLRGGGDIVVLGLPRNSCHCGSGRPLVRVNNPRFHFSPAGCCCWQSGGVGGHRGELPTHSFGCCCCCCCFFTATAGTNTLIIIIITISILLPIIIINSCTNQQGSASPNIATVVDGIVLGQHAKGKLGIDEAGQLIGDALCDCCCFRAAAAFVSSSLSVPPCSSS